MADPKSEDAQQPPDALTIEELAANNSIFQLMPDIAIPLLARTIVELQTQVDELREWKDREDTYRFEQNR
jgi:hypothetical protein